MFRIVTLVLMAGMSVSSLACSKSDNNDAETVATSSNMPGEPDYSKYKPAKK